VDVTGPPDVRPDSVAIPWAVTYERAGAPPLTIRGRSTARFTGDRIAYLHDAYEDGIGERAAAWLQAHGAGLDGSYV
jgi:hypothetical protein